jgi:cyanophycinase
MHKNLCFKIIMIILVGGNLDKSEKSVILKSVRSRISDDKRIALIPTASEMPDEIGNEYEDALKLFGFRDISILHIKKREDAYIGNYIKSIEEADMVLLTGGDQLKLTSFLGGTAIPEIIRRKALSGIVMGVSAGATVLSNPMIYDGKGRLGFRKGEVELTSGFGLLDNIVVDTHFVKRGRIPRLIYVVVSNPNLLGIGLGENTALFVDKSRAEVLGTDSVIVVDGLHMRDTTIATVKKGKPIAATNICMHVLAHGSVMDLNERRVLTLG